MSDVFVSYAREDRARVQKLAEALEAQGLSVWWDRTIRSGQRFHSVIQEALASARCVIVVWSQHSVDSDWVQSEAEEGRQRGILVPLLLENVAPPLPFRQLQAAELAQWDGDHQNPEFQKLVADIRLLMEPAPYSDSSERQPAPPKRPPPVLRASRDSVFSKHRRSFLWAAGASLVLVAITLATLLAPEVEKIPVTDGLSAELAENGSVRLSAALGRGGEPVAADWLVYEAETDVRGESKLVDRTYQTDRPLFTLPAGEYWARATLGKASATKNFEVGPNELTRVELVLDAGNARLSVALAQGGERVAADWLIYEAETDVRGESKLVDRAYQTDRPLFTLPAGKYWARATLGKAGATKNFEVGPNELTRVELVLDAGNARLSVALAQGGERVAADWLIYEAETDVRGESKLVDRAYQTDRPLFTLPAGEYWARATLGKASATKNFEVGPNELTRVELVLDAGNARLSVALAQGGERVAADWLIYEAETDVRGESKLVDRAYQTNRPLFTLPAGKYWARATLGEASATRNFEVRAGENVDVQLIFTK